MKKRNDKTLTLRVYDGGMWGHHAITAGPEWRREVLTGGPPPDHVAVHVMTVRDGCEQWNCISLTPRRARKVAARMLEIAEVIEARHEG